MGERGEGTCEAVEGWGERRGPVRRWRGGGERRWWHWRGELAAATRGGRGRGGGGVERVK